MVKFLPSIQSLFPQIWNLTLPIEFAQYPSLASNLNFPRVPGKYRCAPVSLPTFISRCPSLSPVRSVRRNGDRLRVLRRTLLNSGRSSVRQRQPDGLPFFFSCGTGGSCYLHPDVTRVHAIDSLSVVFAIVEKTILVRGSVSPKRDQDLGSPLETRQRRSPSSKKISRQESGGSREGESTVSLDRRVSSATRRQT